MKFKFLTICFILSALPLHSEVRVLVTSSLKGNYDACYCQLEPISGLELRSQFLQKYKKKFKNVILLETGNLFSKETTNDQEKKILDSYHTLGYQAISVSYEDLLLSESIRENKNSLPLLGNFPSVKKIKPYRILNAKEGKLMIFGWATHHHDNGNSASENSYWAEIQNAIPQETPDLKILIGSISEKEIQSIRQKVNFDLAILDDEKTIPFEQSKDIFRFGKNGEHIGEFIFTQTKGKWNLKSKKLYSVYKNQKIE